MHVRRTALAALCLALVAAAPAGAQNPRTGVDVEALDRAGVRDIVVRRIPGVDAAGRADVRADADVTLQRAMRVADAEVVRAQPGELAEAIARLAADPAVRYAEPVLERSASTNDQRWSSLWALENTGQNLWPGYGYPVGSYIPGGTADADMDVPAAWDDATGTGVTVAVVDTGLLRTHEDLVNRLATNPGETGTDGDGADRRTNGADDDANGLVDDWQGYDFISGANEGDATAGRDNDPQDDHGHGTHVAGTIAAQAGNGIGIAGVAPDARIMPLRGLGSDGYGTSVAIADAFDYAGDLGVPVVNASLSGPGLSDVELDAIEAHPNTLYVVAAGNNSLSVDDNPRSPCSLAAANILCVGATDSDDAMAGFSNFGAVSVDVLAPGTAIVSASIDGAAPYEYMEGTSMASPNTAGVAALARDADPTATAGELKAAIMGTVDAKAALAGLSVTGGRVNAAAAVASIVPPPLNDRDGDGVGDDEDAFPDDPAEWLDTDADGTGDNADTDDDGDGHPDMSDAFPKDAGEWLDTDADGTGDNADTDDDGDGHPDVSDAFPKNAGEWLDTDADGTGDNADADDDGDGHPDVSDAFPKNAGEWLDTDADGTGDNADADDDGDGHLDTSDAFPKDASEWLDTDNDGTGNNNDGDDDGDGRLDVIDVFPADGGEWQDTDGDGTGDNADGDDDGDGQPDASDPFPKNPGEARDTDGDGTGDNADADDDGDGLSDRDEGAAGTDPLRRDTDGDGVRDDSDAYPTDPTRWLVAMIGAPLGPKQAPPAAGTGQGTTVGPRPTLSFRMGARTFSARRPLRLRVVVNRPGTLTVTLNRRTCVKRVCRATPVRTLLTARAVRAGSMRITVSTGRGAARLRTGAYTVTATVTATGGGTATGTARVRVVRR